MKPERPARGAPPWEDRARPFKEALNAAYEALPREVKLGAIAICATDFKRQLAGRGAVSVQHVSHWLTYPGRGRRTPRSRAGGASPWSEANARIPIDRDDLWALILAIAKEGGLWRLPETGDRGARLLDYQLAAEIASSLGFRTVPRRLLEEAAAGRPIAPLIARWTQALDSTSPIVMDGILRHLLRGVLDAKNRESAPAGIVCVAGLSRPAIPPNAPLVDHVFEFVRRGGCYAVVVPFDAEASPVSARNDRAEVVRKWIEFIQVLRMRFKKESIGSPEHRVRLIVPQSGPRATEALTLAMKLVPPFLGEEARPLLVATRTGLPPDGYSYRIGVMLSGADGSRRLVHRYPVEEWEKIDSEMPIETRDLRGPGDERASRAEADRAEADRAITADFFSAVLDHWKKNDHRDLKGEMPEGLWRFAL